LKNRTKIASVLSFVLILASIINVSATVGVVVGDKFNYNIEMSVIDETSDYTVTGDLEIEVTLIEGNTITFNYSGTDAKIKGTYPDDYDLTDGSEVLSLEIFNDDLLTNASLMSGPFFIDKDFTPKTFSYSANVSDVMTVEMSIESEYDDDGVLKNFETTSVFSIPEISSSEYIVKINRSGFTIPGYSVLIVGLVFLLAIPVIVRKIRR